MQFTQARRRSVDVGGLSLAMENQGLGHGWGGWDEHDPALVAPDSTRFAELLTDMRDTTLHAVYEHSFDPSPPQLTLAARTRLIASLGSWHFEPHKLPAEEVVACALILFEALFRIDGLSDAVGVSFSAIPAFMLHLRAIYREPNAYHNFIHAVDVLQAIQSFLCAAGRVPPPSFLLEEPDPSRTWRVTEKSNDGPPQFLDSLSREDLFILYIAAIGHDVGHPGFTNNFMKNAKTPLSTVYSNQSALEQLHCTLLIHLLRFHGLSRLLDDPCKIFRRRLVCTVLATDMSLHFVFMGRLKALIDGEQGTQCERTTTISQAMLKCADISNPSRPHGVSQYWAAALFEEWTSQAALETSLDLPPTVQPSSGPLAEARSQVWFIENFAHPLLLLTTEAIPEMKPYTEQCCTNFSLWQTKVEELESSPPPEHPDECPGAAQVDCGSSDMTSPRSVDAGPSARPPSPPISETSTAPEDFRTVFPLTLPAHLRTPREDIQQRPFSRSSSSFAEHPQPGSPRSDSSGSSAAESSVFSPVSVEQQPLVHADISSSASVSDQGISHLSQQPPLPVEAIRAAFQASVRKRKSFYRNSWVPSSELSWGA